MSDPYYRVFFPGLATSPQIADWQNRVGTEVFTKKLSGLQNLTYIQRLKVLGLESLERRTLTMFDLVICHKIIHAHCNTTLEFTRGCTVTRGNMYKMSKQNCTIDTTKYLLATVLLMCGIVFQILLWLPHHSMILKNVSTVLISVNF